MQRCYDESILLVYIYFVFFLFIEKLQGKLKLYVLELIYFVKFLVT